MPIPVDVLSWARAHHGLITAAAWEDHVGSRSAFHRAIRAGVLVPVTVGVAGSELETIMRSIFRQAGLDGWVFHECVEGYEVDFCFPGRRVIVEVDGWEDHARYRSGWEHERERDLLLQSVGWLVVHVTWRMVTRQAEACVARIRSAMAMR